MIRTHLNFYYDVDTKKEVPLYHYEKQSASESMPVSTSKDPIAIGSMLTDPFQEEMKMYKYVGGVNPWKEIL